MFSGKVVKFDAKKGFGFIEDNEGKQYFAFITSFKNRDEKYIEDNAEVEFEIAQGLKGPQAVNIILL
ncbi:cold-shock protein [Companilactobacillus sp. RD055328]|uniref:cold-shock protein n=1 Tax=Companilactobacillus sp. RD055328 TaxID=2916634 RepID=UPI001FC8B682|nr:cold shock domain-containing protein [Companilactobacillus sp. RD055328]GKQ42841.1 cold-shock protein [Companilactobacillus sp. RD055328]